MAIINHNFFKKSIVVFSLLFAVVMIYFAVQQFYYRVDGDKIEALLTNTRSRTIQIEKTYESSETSYVMAQIILNDEQETTLEALLNGTTFKRITSSYVPITDQERYLITATTDGEKRIYFRLQSLGGDIITVDWIPGDSEAKHWKLKIQNNE